MPRQSTWCAAAILFLMTPVCAFGVDCGDVITTDTTLTADVGPCASDTDPVLTVVGPATLNLNGHGVHCLAGAQPEIGIALEGGKAKLRNGVVEGCAAAAVSVVGTGGHRIENVVAQRNSNDGFQVFSPRNQLLHNTTSDNHDDGFMVAATGNRLIGNTAFRDANGFSVSGEHNAVMRNTAVQCDVGLGISGSRHRAVDNRVVRGGYLGITVSGSGHLVSANQAIGNHETGISATATATRFFDNVALGNERHGDLHDENATCADNQWRRNVFLTADPACIH